MPLDPQDQDNDPLEVTGSIQKTEMVKLQRELQLRTDLSRVVASYINPDELMPNLLAILCKGFGSNGGAVYFIEKWSDEITLKASYGLDSEYASRYQKIDLGSHVTGIVAETGEGILISDASVDQRSTKGVVDLLKYRSAVVTPVISEGNVVGIIALISETPGFFTEKDLKLLDAIGGHISLAIVNSFLNQEIIVERERMLDLLEKLDEGIFEIELPEPIPIGENAAEMSRSIYNEGVFTMVNSSFRRQCSEEVRIGVPMKHGFDEMQLFRMLSEVSTKGEVKGIERRWLGEKERLLEVSLLRVDRGGLVKGVKGIRRDVTKRLKMEEKLKESKSKTEFYLDLFSHDVANINTAVLGFIEVHEHFDHDPREMRSYINVIKDEIKRSSRLLKKVNTLSKIHSEAPDLRPVNISNKIGPNFDRVKRQYQDKKSFLNFNTFESKVTVLGDDLIDDLLQNIFRVGFELTQGDTVELQLESKRWNFDDVDGYLFNFTDRGQGLPDPLKEKIFHNREMKDGIPPGSGLTLSVVKEITDRYGGKVWIEDRVKGDHSKGTRIMVFLPSPEE